MADELAINKLVKLRSWYRLSDMDQDIYQNDAEAFLLLVAEQHRMSGFDGDMAAQAMMNEGFNTTHAIALMDMGDLAAVGRISDGVGARKTCGAIFERQRSQRRWCCGGAVDTR